MSRDEFKKLIEQINAAKCASVHHVEDEVEGFYGSAKEIESNLDADKHRWYEITTSVYSVGDYYLGIRGPSNLFSETMDWESCCEPVTAFEMEEVQSVAYRKKAE